MSKTMNLRFAAPSIALVLSGMALGACATSNETGDLPPPKKPADGSVLDTSGGETGDSSVGDGSSDSAPLDMGTCTPLTSETKSCGKCGKRTRTCSSGGTWNEWSTCSGEDPSAECSVDEVRAAPCGNCGTQKDTCDPTSCTWSTGVCLGEGVCAPGDTDTSTASCSTVGEVRIRTCSDKCAWGAYSDCTLPKGWLKMAAAPTGFDARYLHSAVWTGTNMIVWGGYGSYTSPSYVYVKPTGASYNLSADTWTTIAAAPTVLSTGRWRHTAVWTGSQMLVWGGLNSTSSSSPTNTGAAYDPSTNTWPKTLASTTLAPRYDHVAVWSSTTNEMLVWGGLTYSSSYTPLNDGAAYNPSADTWTAMPPAPLSARYRASAVWTGSELIIWGGLSATSFPAAAGTILRDGARYDPKTKVWTKFPDPPAELDARWDTIQVWSGKELLVFGGVGVSLSSPLYYARNDGARYLPGGSWTRFTPPSDDIFATGTSAARAGIQAWFGGGKLFMWGGAPTSSSYYGSLISGGGGLVPAGGVTYDPSTDKWTTLDLTDAPTARARASVVWTGKEALIWGGSNYGSGSTFYADGAIYRP